MKLNDFLKALKTKDIKVILVDSDENELIRFYSDGYEGVESDILDADVKKWFINSTTAIKIYIDYASESNDSPSETPSDAETTPEQTP